MKWASSMFVIAVGLTAIAVGAHLGAMLPVLSGSATAIVGLALLQEIQASTVMRLSTPDPDVDDLMLEAMREVDEMRLGGEDYAPMAPKRMTRDEAAEAFAKANQATDYRAMDAATEQAALVAERERYAAQLGLMPGGNGGSGTSISVRVVDVSCAPWCGLPLMDPRVPNKALKYFPRNSNTQAAYCCPQGGPSRYRKKAVAS